MTVGPFPKRGQHLAAVSDRLPGVGRNKRQIRQTMTLMALTVHVRQVVVSHGDRTIVAKAHRSSGSSTFAEPPVKVTGSAAAECHAPGTAQSEEATATET